MSKSRFYRSERDSVIGGVCGGLGSYLDTDPIIFRVLFILAVLIGGSGILVYIILWIAIPVEYDVKIKSNNLNHDNMTNENQNSGTGNKQNGKPVNPQKTDGNLMGGLILIALGAIFLIIRFVPRIDFGDLWPLILIVIGVVLIVKSYQQPK